MKYETRIRDEFIEAGALRYRRVDKAKIGVGNHRPKVVHTSSRTVVNDGDSVAILEQTFDEMRSDKAGSAGDQELRFQLSVVSCQAIELPLRSI